MPPLLLRRPFGLLPQMLAAVFQVRIDGAHRLRIGMPRQLGDLGNRHARFEPHRSRRHGRNE